MRFDVKTGSVTQQRTTCLILPIYSEGPLPQATRAIDSATDGLISELIDAGDISGKTGTTLLFKPSDGLACKRVLLVGCGTRGAFGRKNLRKALSRVNGQNQAGSPLLRHGSGFYIKPH